MEAKRLLKLSENLDSLGKFDESDKVLREIFAQFKAPAFEGGGFLGINAVNSNSLAKWIVNLLATNRPDITMAVQKAWQGGDMTEIIPLAQKAGLKDIAELQAFLKNHEKADIIAPMIQANLNVMKADLNRGRVVAGPTGGVYLGPNKQEVPVAAGYAFPKDMTRKPMNGWTPVLLVDGSKSWFKNNANVAANQGPPIS